MTPDDADFAPPASRTAGWRASSASIALMVGPNAGWVVTHDQLLVKVWGYEYRDEPHYVRLYINYLRQKLEKDPANPKYILTERGVGYRFVDYKRQKA